MKASPFFICGCGGDLLSKRDARRPRPHGPWTDRDRPPTWTRGLPL